MEHVILVNEKDEELGSMEKIEAHAKALLHRAFSVFIINQEGQMLLQQRALNKYHSGGLWTNACCSHPRPGEHINDAAQRRLNEEMGFKTTLHKAFHFTYKTSFDNGLTENEFDHVFIGKYDGTIKPNVNEIKDYCFKKLKDIQLSLQSHPQKYTHWFRVAFPQLLAWLKKNKQLHSY